MIGGKALCPTPQMINPDCPSFQLRATPMGPSFQPWEREGLLAPSSKVRPEELMDPQSPWHWLGARAREACLMQAPHFPDGESRPS